MQETLLEYCDLRSSSARVDRRSGVIGGVKVLGLESRNGRAYLETALEAARPLYEGTKVHVNHAKSAAPAVRDYEDRIGVLRNITLRRGDGLYGDLHFNPKHAIAEQLVWDAEHTPENVGLSHHVEARVARRGDRTVVESITKVLSVDLVADPATTRGLFESAADSPREEADRNVRSTDVVKRPDEANVCETESTALQPSPCPLPVGEGEDAARGVVLGEAAHSELVDEVARIAREVERLAAALGGIERRELVRRVLAEHGLPMPEASDAWSRAVASAAFIETLYAARDERAVRRLVEERVALVEATRPQPAAARAARIEARDQLADSAAAWPSTTAAFVRSVRGAGQR